LLAIHPQVRPQVYFKSSLVALSHAMEDMVLSEQGQPLVMASFQRERFYRQEAARYQRISAIAAQVYVLAMPETDFHAEEGVTYERVALDPGDPLTKEWHLIIADRAYSACLVCREKPGDTAVDAARQFEGYWSFDPSITLQTAQLLLLKIVAYRPDLAAEIARLQAELSNRQTLLPPPTLPTPDPFSQRLMTYLQAGQYKLQRAYKAIQRKERAEHSINQIVAAMRQSLDANEMLQVVVQQLGETLDACRCLLYRCSEKQAQVTIDHEYVKPGVTSLQGRLWPLRDNPLLDIALQQGQLVQLGKDGVDWQQPEMKALCDLWHIRAWLAVPILYRGRLLGTIELHRCGDVTIATQPEREWPSADAELVTAIALQAGVALIQAEAYEHLNELNRQLAELDRAKSDLIAVTGHELRTPLSTIQVCLESLATEPDMPLELRQIMLDTAMQDSERLRTLVQDFLTLSQLESGRVNWHLEPLPPQECIDLALSSIRARFRQKGLPDIAVEVADDLPLVNADGEWLVEVLSKLLDNACKFTPASGRIEIRVQPEWAGVSGNSRPKQKQQQKAAASAIRFTVTDTGRGIEPAGLQQIFERFYQSERSLRRTVGGTGLGLAICRQVVEGMGGTIWAESAGSGRGSTFHFTVPVATKVPSVAGSTRLLA
jgi:DICT domain-containing protein/nitrogen-specific signal transduction histidine kinase